MFMKYRINFKHLNRKSSKKSINLIFRIIINKLLRKKGWKIVIWNWSKLSSNLTSKRSKNGNSNLLEDYGVQHRTVVHVGKTKRKAAGRRFQSMPGKMQIMLQDFRDFRGADNHEEDKTAKKKKERENSGGCRPMVSARQTRYHGTTVHTHCGQAGSLLFHAAKYRVLFTRRC